MAVPSETAIDPLASHGPEAWYGVFYKPGEQMPVMGETVGKWGSVVEDELSILGRVRIQCFLENMVGIPVREYLLLYEGITRLLAYLGIGIILCIF